MVEFVDDRWLAVRSLSQGVSNGTALHVPALPQRQARLRVCLMPPCSCAPAEPSSPLRMRPCEVTTAKC